MKVMMINGSPHSKGNTYVALDEMKKVFETEDVEVDYLHIGNKIIRGCVGCNQCQTKGKCVFDDVVNETVPILKEADGVVIGTPVYWASANGTLNAYLDRLFFSTMTSMSKTMKVGAAVVVARRGGCSSTFDQINKYFMNSEMPVASSQYWNMVYGLTPGEARQDIEGLQTMRTLARNMIFMMKSFALGKEKFGLPKKEEWTPTHFIR